MSWSKGRFDQRLSMTASTPMNATIPMPSRTSVRTVFTASLPPARSRPALARGALRCSGTCQARSSVLLPGAVRRELCERRVLVESVVTARRDYGGRELSGLDPLADSGRINRDEFGELTCRDIHVFVRHGSDRTTTSHEYQGCRAVFFTIYDVLRVFRDMSRVAVMDTTALGTNWIPDTSSFASRLALVTGEGSPERPTPEADRSPKNTVWYFPVADLAERRERHAAASL